MAHCGYEPTAAEASLKHPLKALALALGGVRTEGPMAPEISLTSQTPKVAPRLRTGRQPKLDQHVTTQ